MLINAINTLYTFSVSNSAVIPGEFVNMKLLRIVGYNDAILIDSNLPELMRVLGFESPENETYYIFSKDGELYAICNSWIDENTIIGGNTISNMSLTVNDLTNDDRNHITNFLNTYSYKYTIA